MKTTGAKQENIYCSDHPNRTTQMLSKKISVRMIPSTPIPPSRAVAFLHSKFDHWRLMGLGFGASGSLKLETQHRRDRDQLKLYAHYANFENASCSSTESCKIGLQLVSLVLTMSDLSSNLGRGPSYQSPSQQGREECNILPWSGRKHHVVSQLSLLELSNKHLQQARVCSVVLGARLSFNVNFYMDPMVLNSEALKPKPQKSCVLHSVGEPPDCTDRIKHWYIG